MKKLMLTLLLLAGCSQAPVDISERGPASVAPQASWKSYLESRYGSLKKLLTEPQYVVGNWTTYDEMGVNGSEFPPSKITVVPLKCADKKLYPTHPQQFTKEYLMGLTSDYMRQEMPGSASSCITPNFNKKYCLNSQRGVVAVLSDTYQDSCGNYYRGYWMLAYRVGGGPNKTEDTMGTLFAKGRVQYEKPHAQFPGAEFIDGNTYPVEEKAFLFLGTLLPKDQARIKDALGYAAKSGFTKRGLIFIPKGQR